VRRTLVRNRRPPVRPKTPDEIAAMRRAGRVVGQALEQVSAAIAPGVTTAELDRIADEVIASAGGVASFKGVPAIVPGAPPFPAASCVSVNEEVVHGIPGPRVLQQGDIVSIDVGAIVDGWHGDAAITVAVGPVSEEAERLIQVTRDALVAGISQARAGGWLGDISAAIQSYGEEHGLSVVREFTGHAIGREMHEGLQIPNFGTPGTGARLRAGMTLAIEPMFTLGSPRVSIRRDGWTVVTLDGSLSAHWEHTIAITDGEPEILTAT